MHDEILRVVGLLALTGPLALAGVQASSAATVTGGGTFSSSAGVSRFVITGGAAPLNCTTSGMSFTVANGSYGSFPAVVGTLTPTFAICNGPLGWNFTYNCAASPPATLALSGDPVSGATPGVISGIRCVETFTLTGCQAVIEGNVPISYTNPALAPPNGRLTVLVAGQSLNVTSTGCPSIIPLGAVSIGAPSGSGTGLANLSYYLTTPGPTIT